VSHTSSGRQISKRTASENAALEAAAVALHSDYPWRSNLQWAPAFLEIWRPIVNEGVRLGEQLYKTHLYERAREEEYPALEAYQSIIEESEKLQ
jgi:hypothetical protein